MKQDGPTHLWLANLDRAAPALSQLERTSTRLSADDVARVNIIGDPGRKSTRRAAAIALRIVLEATFGAALRHQTPLPRDRYGRPQLPDGPEFPNGMTGSFSLAHAGPWALIGVTREAHIGVDIEIDRTVRMDVRRRAIIEAASESLIRIPLPTDAEPRFLQAWVLLEALAKADGRGIGHLLTQLGAVGGKGHDDAAADLAREHGLSVHSLDVGPGVYAGLACAGIAPKVLALPETPAGLTDLLAPNRA